MKIASISISYSCSVSVNPYIDSGTEGLVYELNGDSTAYSVTGYTGQATAVHIPATYNDKPVTSIGDYAFFGCSSIASIVIPLSVTSIGDSAFSGCSSLTSVTIRSGVTSIDGLAFSYCSSLASIVIPLSVTSIGDSAFNECSKLSIFAEAASLPSGWNAGYNPTPCPVYWYSEAKNTDGSHWHYVSDVPTLWA